MPCYVAEYSLARWDTTNWHFLVAPIAEGKGWWTHSVRILPYLLLIALLTQRLR